MTPTDVQHQIRAYVAKGSGIPARRVIPGNDIGPRPDEPYASVLVVEDHIEIPTQERYRPNPGDSEETIIDAVQTRRARLSIQFFRENTDVDIGAYAGARNFSSWIETATGKQAADVAGFRIDGPVTVRRLDELVASNWEQRAGVELEVLYRYREPASQDVGTIENVEIVVKGPADSQETTVDGE